MGARLRGAAVGLGVALFAAIGCGQDGPKTYPVNGKVAYKGKGDMIRLSGGQVIFESVAEPRVTASGEIERDGAFTLGCLVEGKQCVGVPAGEYRVRVKPPPDEGSERAVHPKYLSADKSGVTVTVTPGTNTPTIEVEAGR
jgi:hypothetical protein